MGYWLACALDGGCVVMMLALAARIAVDMVLSPTGMVILIAIAVVAWRRRRK